MNLKSIQIQDNALGLTIVSNWESRPEEVLHLIRDGYQVNPEAIVKTIGLENARYLGLLSALDTFEKYFPRKVISCNKGLQYEFDQLAQVFEGMKRAKGIIRDWHLPLQVQMYSAKGRNVLLVNLIK